MDLTRREFFIGFFWSALALRSGGVAATQGGPNEQETMRSFVDTLLPADDFSPAASEVGVAEIVDRWFTAGRGRRVLRRRGCAWLNAQAAGDFTALTDGQRERIVERMMEAPRSTGPRVFYERARDEAVTAYYAQPA